MNNLGYPDLQDANFVFEALLGHGMFTDKLPPCFTSESLLQYAKHNSLSHKPILHSYIEYNATRNTNVPRQLAIPHPESYWNLCWCIKKNWQMINEHIGKPDEKFNFCHIRKIKDEKKIFKMNYAGAEKWSQEELELDYSLGCEYVVSADVSTCFPSIYAHSIPWAIKGKEWAKKHMCNSWKKNKHKGCNCRKNNNQPCPYNKNDLWPNDLDAITCSLKDGETNGLLIGPHTSNIISEIIFTQVDFNLQNANFTKVIRHIDDYAFFAKDEIEARNFLRTLRLELKKYELVLNAKKTKIIPYTQYKLSHWTSQINQFLFPDRKQLGFTSINSYIDYALNLSREFNDYAVLNYAIKVVSKKKLSSRASRLYVKKIIQIALDHPYIVPLLEEYVFIFSDGNFEFLDEFLNHLIRKSLVNETTASLAFSFYYALKYNIEIKNVDWKEVVSLDDCISLLLAYKYCEKQSLKLDAFNEKAEELSRRPKRDHDKFWLFLYEILPKHDLSGLLKKLKKNNVSFLDTKYALPKGPGIY